MQKYKLKRRRIRRPLDEPFIYFEGGGKRTYRRRKTRRELRGDKRVLRASKALADWRKELIRDEIITAFYGTAPARPIKDRIKELRKSGERINVELIKKLKNRPLRLKARKNPDPPFEKWARAILRNQAFRRASGRRRPNR